MKKKLLIDLYKLKTPNCGLGQVALNYGKYFSENYSQYASEYEVYLLVPASFVGQFGSDLNYIRATWWRRYFPFLFPKMDLWHSTYQMPPFRPFWSSTKLILTVHDLNFFYEKSASRAKSYFKRLKRDFRRADAVVAISEFTKSEIIRYLGLDENKIKVIHNGVEFLQNKDAAQPLTVDVDKNFFFSIGQVLEKKNFHTLVSLMSYFPDKNLYIAGNHRTAYGERIKRQIEAENIKNVFLLGEVKETEKVWLYEHCEAFLFPSLFEGFGLPVIEALSFGKPVFSSRETSLKEIGGEHVYFWDSFEPKAMSDVVKENLPLFYASGEMELNAKIYASKFTYEEHFKKYFSLYKSI